MKPKVAFICVHNSCRSQIAEALGKLYATDVFDSYSAGTEIKSAIDKTAVKLIKEIYHIDMTKTQTNKLIDVLPPIDIVITMGCNVECPYLPSKYRFDWGLEDPVGKSEAEYLKIIRLIDQKVQELKAMIIKKELII